jgi:hypothetical protein
MQFCYVILLIPNIFLSNFSQNILYLFPFFYERDQVSHHYKTADHL